MIKIDALLKEKALTKQDLAKKMDTSRENLYRIINGNPTLQNLEKIADALEVSIWQLFPGSGHALNGFIEYKGIVYRILSKEDLENILKLVKE